MKVLTLAAAVLFTANLNAQPLSEQMCWTSFEKAPENLEKLCLVSGSSVDGDKVYAFRADFSDGSDLYQVIDSSLPVGGKCSWAQGFKMVDLEMYASDADHVKMGFVKFCDENGPTETKLTGTLPSGQEVVTSGK